MKLRWSNRSLSNLSDLHAYISEDNLAAANRVVAKIEEAVETLRNAPLAGRKGRVAGTRELVIPGTPYVVGYTLEADAIYILAVVHGKQGWPDRF